MVAPEECLRFRFNQHLVGVYTPGMVLSDFADIINRAGHPAVMHQCLSHTLNISSSFATLGFRRPVFMSPLRHESEVVDGKEWLTS